MKKEIAAVFILVILGLTVNLHAQQLPIDSTAIVNWPTLGMVTKSPSGEYITYEISIGSNVYTANQKRMLIIRSVLGKWEEEINSLNRGSKYTFTADNKFFLLSQNDSLYIYKLGKKERSTLSQVSDFSLSGNNTNDEITLKDKDTTFIYNIQKKELSRIGTAKNISFNKDGNHLVYSLESDKEGSNNLYIRDLLSHDEPKIIWAGKSIRNITWDKTGNHLAFIAPNENKQDVFIYNLKDNAARKIEIKGEMNPDQVTITKINGFSEDFNYLYVQLTPKPIAKPKPTGIMVDIWNYKDLKLQSVQAKESNVLSYKANLNLTSGALTQLDFGIENSSDFINDKLLVSRTQDDVDRSEYFWNDKIKRDWLLVDAKSGKRKLIDSATSFSYEFSPSGKFLFSYNFKENRFYTYNISNGIIKNITANLNVDWHIFDNDHVDKSVSYRPVAWLPGDSGMIIPDQYDLWLIDPKGIISPQNLTNGYGRKNSIAFRPAIGKENTDITFEKNGEILLSAFDRITKKNGFFYTKLNESGNPHKLSFDNEVYSFKELNLGMQPIKAGKGYIVFKESVKESRNIYYTENFTLLRPISNIYPEKSYQWFKSELLYTKQSRQDSIAGVLYKPDRFDPSRKYPIIFVPYEKKSQYLNKFFEPEFPTGEINIPWFVTRNYLIFAPDIKYSIGHPGESALNAILSFAGQLSKLPFVDSTKMGIQGVSFGGYEVNYIVTHTNKFAAAMSGVGISDITTMHSEIMETDRGVTEEATVEIGQIRMGVAPWENPQLYMENSPIFFAKNVATPFFLVSNKGDRRINYLQGLHLFTALRRLNKPAWLLQYDNSSHGMFNLESIDYNKRLDQFFGHYLKSEPAPVWMTKGVPFKDKGIISGFDYN